MPGSFFDTNVLLYLLSDDQAKAEQAGARVIEGGTISVQVLNEIANAGRRKLRLGWDELHDLLATIRDLCPVRPLTIETHDAGLALAERYGLSLYDAMIVASALEAGCDVLWSEDMQHGLVLEGALQVRNPFQQP
jgi:predicted nucleic acid-binding protein